MNNKKPLIYGLRKANVGARITVTKLKCKKKTSGKKELKKRGKSDSILRNERKGKRDKMEKRMLPKQIIEEMRKKIGSYEFKIEHRKRAADFSRESILEIQDVMCIVLNLVKSSAAIEMYKYFERKGSKESVTGNGLKEARKKVSHTAFEELFKDGVRAAMEAEDMRYFRGYRAMGIDGSTELLEYSEALKKEFGEITPRAGDVYARISTCVDVVNGFVADGIIAPYSTGERELAKQHIDNITDEKALYLMDRGYWSPELAAKIADKGQKFLIRLASNAIPKVTASRQDSGHISVAHKGKDYRFRYYKFMLKSGEMEYLLTNLTEDEVSDSELGDLYWLRWGIETKYAEIKEKLQLENLSGKTPLFVKQDFFATLWVVNMICFMTIAAESDMPDRQRQYKYKPNKNFSIAVFRHSFISIVVEDHPLKRDILLHRLISEISKNIVPIRPDRLFHPRNSNRTIHRNYMSKKSPL